MRKLVFLVILSLMTVAIFACGKCDGCSNSATTLKMLMGIGVKVQQQFEATATAYEASFCGFTGMAVDYTPLTVKECGCGWLKTATYVKIAQVNIASNYPAVIVNVSYKDTLSPHLDSKVYVFSENGGMCDVVYLKWSGKCHSGEMSFKGAVYVALPREIGRDRRPGKYISAVTFTISSICPCSP